MIEDLGSRRDNKFSIWDLEKKLQYVDDHFEDMCKHPERMEEFEKDLGLPISFSARAVVPLSQKIKVLDKSEERKKQLEAAEYVEKIWKEAEQIHNRWEEKKKKWEEFLALETQQMMEEWKKWEEERKLQLVEKL